MKRRVGHFCATPMSATAGVPSTSVCTSPKGLRIPYHNKADGFTAALLLTLNQVKFCELHNCQPNVVWSAFPRANTPACAFLVGRPSLMRATAQMPSSISFVRFAKATRRHSRSRRRSRASSASRSTACCRGRCGRTIMARRVRRPLAARVRMRRTTPRGMASSVRRARAL